MIAWMTEHYILTFILILAALDVLKTWAGRGQ